MNESNVSDKKINILYIEDNPTNLRLVSRLLASRPHIHLWTAHEPFLGLELAITHEPDLILLDINLPGMDGYEVLKRLHEQPETQSIPVIAITANATETNLKKGKEAGFADYLTKPIDVSAFYSAIDNILLADNSE